MNTLADQYVPVRPAPASLFGATMGYVAATSAFFAAGAALGRHLSAGWGLVGFVAAFVCLLAMRASVSRSSGTTVALLMSFGALIGLATAPTLTYYAQGDPTALWESATATALFMAGLGVAGYTTHRDLSGLARIALFALVGLILFGIVTVFVAIPAASLIYSLAGLVIFAALTAGDFQRLRRAQGIESAPLLAASIFLDALNVFLFFLRLFRRR